MNVKSDTVLLKLIQEDDQKALEQLFEKYYYCLCEFAFQYVRNFNLTEEVVSDIFLKIWKKRHTLRIYGNFKTYLYTATRNQAINYLQKEKREQEWKWLEDGMVSDNFRPDEELIFKELENHINDLLNTLPPRRKLIFKLSRIEGFTYREIADILSISIHTVQNQMVKAVKQLGSFSLVDV